MAESINDPEVWLRSQFLTDDDLLMGMGKENLSKNGFSSGRSFSFFTEFPYEFDSNSALSSPVESVAGSTEAESSDEDDFFAGLARRLTQSSIHETQKLAVPSFTQKSKPERVLAGSPQSTLSGIGSWSGRSAVSSNGSPNGPSQVPSPPTTPFLPKNDTWDLIYAAAGQVARLKLSGEAPKYNHQSRGLLVPPKTTSTAPASAPKTCNFGLYPNQSLTHNLPQPTQFQHVRQEQVLKPQCSSIWGRQQGKVEWSTQQQQQQQQIQSRVRNGGYENGRCERPLGLAQSAWPSLQVHQNQQPQHNGSTMRPSLLAGSAAKKECAGTGVFLPRKYGSNPPDSRKKTGCPTVLVPAKVVQALNLNFDDLSGHAQPRYNSGLAPEHDALMARRNALLTHQMRSLRAEGAARSHEIRLPQEWTY